MSSINRSENSINLFCNFLMMLYHHFHSLSTLYLKIIVKLHLPKFSNFKDTAMMTIYITQQYML